MAQDIRELFKNDKGIPRHDLREGHEQRFEEKLNKEFSSLKKEENRFKPNYMWVKIAAVVVVLFTVGGLLFKNTFKNTLGTDGQQVVEVSKAEAVPVNLSDLSPEFKKLEDYYMTNINVELAQLDLTSDNKELVDAYMAQLQELNKEYERLNADLVEVGVNDQTVSTLIDNLQLRLDLLMKLKKKLNALKKAPEGETQTNRL